MDNNMAGYANETESMGIDNSKLAVGDRTAVDQLQVEPCPAAAVYQKSRKSAQLQTHRPC